MADDINELKARRAALEAIRDSGVEMSRHGETAVNYRDSKDINASINALSNKIFLLENPGYGVRRRVHYVVQTSKGY